MTEHNKLEIIGIDHGFKNMKTRSHIFKTQIREIETLPMDKGDILEINDKLYSLRGGKISPKETHDKSKSEEFYLLTFPSIAKELQSRGGKTSARVFIAAGLPYKWYDSQKDSFQKKLSSKKNVFFKFEGISYDITIEGVHVFMQGISAIAENSKDYNDDYYVLVDIGGETIEVVPIENGKPLIDECKIDTRASIYCINKTIEAIETKLFNRIREKEVIDTIIRGKEETNDEYIKMIHKELEKYSDEVYKILQELGFFIERTKLVFIGGGSHIIQKFGKYDERKDSFILDLKANAKGYELLEAYVQMKKRQCV